MPGVSRRVGFHPFVLDRQDGVLLRAGERVPLRRKTWTLLCYFIDRPGELLTKDALLDALWPDAAVHEAILSNAVSELRTALQDDARSPRYIEVAHRRGYRWIAELEEAESTPAAQPAPVAPVAHAALPNPTVGRETEMRQLRETLQRVRGGQRYVVFVTGEAGIGKTTLVDQILRELATLAPMHVAGYGACVEQNDFGETFLPVLDALSHMCRQSDGAQVTDALRRHAPMWLAQMPSFLSPAERAAIRDEIAGAPSERMLRELGDAVEAVAVAAPLVLVLEDLHWSDHGTINLLSYLARRRGPAQLLVIATYRPVAAALSDHPVRALRQQLEARKLGEEIALPFLTPQAVAELVALRFPQHALPDELATVIAEHTDGHPLFMTAALDFFVGQEWITAVDGRWALRVPLQQLLAAVPDSLKEMIAQRIEELPEERQRLLEHASLLGVELSTQSLAAAAGITSEVAEEQCAELARRGEVLRACGVSEWPDGTIGERYAFVHALYQKVLAERMAALPRRRVHLRVAERIAAGWGARVSEVCAELALHYDLAGDRLHAMQHLRELATRALYRGSPTDARLAIERCLQLCGSDDGKEDRTEEIDLLLYLAATLQIEHGHAGAKVKEVFDRAAALVATHDMPIHRARILIGMFGWAFFHGHQEQCRTISSELDDLAARLALPLISEFARTLGAAALHARGELQAARRRLETPVSPGLGTLWARPHVAAISAGVRARTLMILGFPEQAAAAEQATSQAGTDFTPFDRTWMLYLATARCLIMRDADGARTALEPLLVLVEQYDYRTLGALVHLLHASFAEEQGGVRHLQQLVDERFRAGLDGERALVSWLLLSKLVEEQQYDDGLELAAAAIEWCTTNGELWILAELHRLRARCLAAERATIEEAAHSFAQAIALAQRQEAKLWELRATNDLARFTNARHRKSALARLRPLYASFTEGLAYPDWKDAQTLLES